MGIKFGFRRNVLNFLALAEGWFTDSDLSVFHEFEPPPAGGGLVARCGQGGHVRGAGVRLRARARGARGPVRVRAAGGG